MGVFPAARVESWPGPLHRPAPTWWAGGPAPRAGGR